MTISQVLCLMTAVIACGFDLSTRRIPNGLTFGSAAAALFYHLMTGSFTGMATSAAGWVVGAAIFFIPFALRGLGGGDVKLLAALGAWLGPSGAIWLALYTGVAGGVMAVVVAVARGYARRAAHNVWLLLCHWRVAGLQALPEITLDGSSAPKLAYALPIFVGTVTVIWLR